MAQVQIQIPPEVSNLLSTISERWGYYLARRVVQSNLMKATTTERKAVRTANQSIKDKLADYIDNGTDVRDEVQTLQGDLKEARKELSMKAKPFHDKKRPLIQALTYLDQTVIPNKLQKVTGNPVMPVFQVSDVTLNALEQANKK